MNKLLKKRMLIISISLAFLLLINIGVSYSYYLGKVVGNESGTTLSFKSAGIKIQYENNSGDINVSDIMPGWSATKNFSISSTVTENQLNETTSNLWYEIYLYVERNDFPSNLVTYSFSSTGNNVGNGLVAESRTNIGLPLSTELNVITIGTGNVAVGANVHNYSITFNYSNENYENGNYPDCIFNAHIKVSAIINSIINLNLDGGEIEGDTTKYVSKGGTITLQTPVKENAVFDGWIVTTGDAIVNGNELTVNDALVEVQAIWIARTISNSILSVNLDGGTWSGDTLIQTETNSIIKLERPTKPYYIFQGWEVVEGNADISGDNIVVYDSNVEICSIWYLATPVFTYKKSDGTDASYIFVEEDDINWKIKFLETGILTFSHIGTGKNGIDVFLVGGGGGSGSSSFHNGGGGGGYTITGRRISVENNLEYDIFVGNGGSSGKSGESSTAFNLIAGGGKPGIGTSNPSSSVGQKGGDGGSGGGGNAGIGGTDGSNGTSNATGSAGGNGQGTTTREFGESNGQLYSGGGAGSWGSPGDGGGGPVCGNGVANTGGGGGGNNLASNASGGSGIVIIRNHRA